MSEADMAMELATGSIKIMLDGSIAVLKIAGKASAHAAALLAAALSGNRKTKGRIRLTQMLKEKGGITLFSVKKDELEAFAKAAKAYGIKYCIVKDKNAKDDGILDIFVRSMDAPVINRIVEKYRMSAVRQDVNIDNEKDQGNSDPLTERENLSGKDYSEQYEQGDVTINIDTLVTDEKENSYVTRVPGTYGEDVRYLEIDKGLAEEVYGGKSLKYHIDADKEYTLTGRYGDEYKIMGKDLLASYDRKDSNKVHSEKEMRPSVREKMKAAEKTSEEIREYSKTANADKSSIYTKTDEKEQRKERSAFKQNAFNNFPQRKYNFDNDKDNLIIINDR